MNPFFFGDSDQALYGVYHPPQNPRANAEAVLICPPFGQEYMRSHRALKQLSFLLAKKGYHVLRFDYRGTGDSAKDLEEVDADDWLQDIKTALTELQAMTACQTINLVGLRLGGLLAAQCCNAENKIKRLILWDPLLSGEAADQEFISIIEQTDEDFRLSNFIDTDNTLHINGFALSSTFRQSLKTYSLENLKPKAESYHHIISSQTPDSEQFKRSASELNSHYQQQFIDTPSDWNYVDHYGAILLPQPIIQAIVEHF